MSLEQTLVQDLKSGNCSMERGLLIASGLKAEGEVGEYEAKIGEIESQFRRRFFGIRPGKERVAEALFRFLWDKDGYYEKGKFRLDDVVDSRLEGSNTYGDCLGLTSLYNALALRLGLDVGVAKSPKHIFSTLDVGGRTIGIEHTSPDGFGLGDSKARRGNNKFLIASVLNSIGSAKYVIGDLEGAKKDYDCALKLDPEDAKAFYNRGIARYELGDLEGAKKDYVKAIEINPDNQPAKRNLELIRGEQ